MQSWLGGTFASLSIPSFRLLWFGTLLAFISFFMSTVVQSVVAFELTGRNDAVGAVVFAQGITMAVLGPIGGAFADRWSKRRVIAVGQLLAGAVFATLAVLLAFDAIHLAFLALGSFLMGATFAFLGPARQALAIAYVPIEMRGNAMALSNVANTASRVFGPAFAGAFLAWPIAGATGAYAAMAALYVVSATSVAWLPHSPPRAGALDRHVFSDVRDGLRYIARNRRVGLLLLFFVTVILAGFPHVTVLPGLLENEMGRPASDVSALYLAAAVGALSASIAVARLADSRHATVVYSLLAFLFGVGLLGLGSVRGYGAAAFMMFVIGVASGGFQALNAAVIAHRTDPDYIGRVMSITLLAFAGFGLMALPYGMLADAIGERPTLVCMGVAVCVISLVMTIVLAVTDDDAAAPRSQDLA